MADIQEAKQELKKETLSAAEELAALDLEIKREQLEELKLNRQEREYSIRDLKAKLADREVKEIQLKGDRETRGQAFNKDRLTNELRWRSCTHRKGGKVDGRNMNALYFGGDNEKYAIMRHQMFNGDIWVKCLRCGCTWKPVVRANFYFDDRGRVVPEKLGKFNEEAFRKAVMEYQMALQWPTGNTMSGSHQFSFTRVNERGERIDAKEDTRVALKDANLT